MGADRITRMSASRPTLPSLQDTAGSGPSGRVEASQKVSVGYAETVASWQTTGMRRNRRIATGGHLPGRGARRVRRRGSPAQRQAPGNAPGPRRHRRCPRARDHRRPLRGGRVYRRSRGDGWFRGFRGRVASAGRHGSFNAAAGPYVHGLARLHFGPEAAAARGPAVGPQAADAANAGPDKSIHGRLAPRSKIAPCPAVRIWRATR
jgi:hypothetical protein